MSSFSKPLWEVRAEKCRKILQDSLNPSWLLSPEALPSASQLNVSTFIESCGLLSPRELEITSLTASELVRRMAARSLTAVETTTAFLKRAHVAHQLTNFATEFLIDDAMRDAAECDAYFNSTGKVRGPLHGVPISVKEHIGIKGRISHATYTVWVDNVCQEDALMIQLVKKAGAVIHVRTNEPQSLMVSLRSKRLKADGASNLLASPAH